MKIDTRKALYLLLAMSALSLAACKSAGDTTDAPAASSAPAAAEAAPADASATPPSSGDGG